MKGATNELDGSEVTVQPRRPAPEQDRDEEEAFAELVQAFRTELDHLEGSRDTRELTYLVGEFVPEDEFTCHGCNLILHRILLGDEEHTQCGRCSANFRAPRGP